MILADANERISHPFDTDDLPVGDFVVEGETGSALIERKEMLDFVQSFRSGHLFNQLRRMMEQPHTPYLVLEHSRRNPFRHTRVREGEVRRYKSSVAVKWDIRLIETQTVQETVLFVQDVEDWLGDNGDSTHAIRPVQRVPEEDRARYIVEGLPGVGPATAEALLNRFGIPLHVFQASRDQLREVEGVGPKTADTIYSAVR